MKIISFFKKVLIITFCSILALVIASYVYVLAYGHFNSEAQSTVLENYSLVKDNLYAVDDTESPGENIAVIGDFLQSLAPNVLATFRDKWAIVFVDEMPVSSDNTEEQPSGDTTETVGYCDWHSRLIYVKSETNLDKFRAAFVHELGHAFDYEFGTPSAMDEFESIYLLYKENYQELTSFSTKDYTTGSSVEFFATMFKEYFLAPEHLKSFAPKAYDFIDTIYNGVSANEAANTTLKYDLQSVVSRIKDLFEGDE